jgi:uncharacterized protein YdeI (YjbR/CyaY-like superfamily)
MATKPELPVLQFATSARFATWLAKQPADSPGVWLKIAKKDSPHSSVTHAQALDVALCHGWIDGQADKFDDDFWIQRFTPRRRASRWSQRNRARALELIETGKMRPGGLREVERAKADGRWDAAYAAQSNATVPDDLRRALDNDELASAFFATLDSRNRFAILYRLHDAKKPETRARRLEQFVTMLREGRTIH